MLVGKDRGGSRTQDLWFKLPTLCLLSYPDQHPADTLLQSPIPTASALEVDMTYGQLNRIYHR